MTPEEKELRKQIRDIQKNKVELKKNKTTKSNDQRLAQTKIMYIQYNL